MSLLRGSKKRQTSGVTELLARDSFHTSHFLEGIRLFAHHLFSNLQASLQCIKDILFDFLEGLPLANAAWNCRDLGPITTFIGLINSNFRFHIPLHF